MLSPMFGPRATEAYRRHGGRRFPVRLDLCYRESGRIEGTRGSGVSRSIGSRYITFTTEHVLQAGLQVELVVDWPAPLNEKTPLNLVIQGRVIRSVGQYAAALIQHHEFRAACSLGPA